MTATCVEMLHESGDHVHLPVVANLRCTRLELDLQRTLWTFRTTPDTTNERLSRGCWPTATKVRHGYLPLLLHEQEERIASWYVHQHARQFMSASRPGTCARHRCALDRVYLTPSLSSLKQFTYVNRNVRAIRPGALHAR
jgi:hypothetical protein